MINIELISKSFGEQVLFNNAKLQINPREKIGLVARNGHGKTTLVRMIAKKEAPDSGTINIPLDYKIGYLTQKINFSKDSVIEECMQGLIDQEKDHYWKAEKILAGLGFSNNDIKKNPQEFSGGFQVRLTLARVLVSEPDLLLLDEPTNYLDITSIRWLSNFLYSWPREILVVTHDRNFMDSITTHIAGIHRQTIRKIKGNTEKYYKKIIQDEKIYEKTRLNHEKKHKQMELFISRFRAKARLAGLVQSRIKTLEKTEIKNKLEKINFFKFSFRDIVFSGKQMLTIENLSFSYDKKKIIDDFSLTVSPKDCIAIIGKNGKGKTTLLKLLAKKLMPCSENIKYNSGVEPGYFEQTNIESLNPNLTVEEEIIYSHKDIDRQKARNICGTMMFQGDKALKHISVLSGGEKSRVMLAKLLAKPLNLLLLDEPTNHLDMESCDSLLTALSNFKGAVILVTHNEMFLHSLANKLIFFKNDTVNVFQGTYKEFLEKDGWEDGLSNNLKNNELNNKKISKKDLRKLRSEIITHRSKILGPLQKKIEEIENNIEKSEEILKKSNILIQKAVKIQNTNEISTISIKIGEHQKKIDLLFNDLEKYSDEFDEKNKIFKDKLKELDKIVQI